MLMIKALGNSFDTPSFASTNMESAKVKGVAMDKADDIGFATARGKAQTMVEETAQADVLCTAQAKVQGKALDKVVEHLDTILQLSKLNGHRLP